MKYDHLKVIPSAVQDMADAAGMPISRIAEVVPDITKDILRTWHTKGESSDVDKRVEDAWLKIFEYPYINIADSITPPYIKGPPGQGKSTAYKVATKTIADAMDVELHIDPDLYTEPKPNDIVMVMSQLGGAMSASPIHGVPTHQNGGTVYLPPSRIAKMVKQDFSLFLLDDLDNAIDHVKNAAMPIVLEKVLPDVRLGDHCFVGATGNLGAIDGTNTGKDSSALLNRAGVTLCCDTLGDFLERGQKRWNDDYGMAFIDEFLEQNADQFYPSVEKKYRGQRPTSRSWDNLINKVRNMLADYDAQASAGLTPRPILPQIGRELPKHIGKKVGRELETFYGDVLTIAFPAAKEVTSQNGLSDQMREVVTQHFTQKATTETESIARSYLRQVSQIVSTRIINIASEPRPNGKQEMAQWLARITEQLDKYCEACFTVGLIQSAKANLIAKQTYEMFDRIIRTGHTTEGDHCFGTFGTLNEETNTVQPASLMIKVLHQSGTQFGRDHKNGEALDNISGNKSQTKTAIQTCFTDPLTHVDQANQMKEELNKLITP
ncbi:hypothetical protein AAFX24_28590 [Vibrio mediterranei]|uniref:hypothetical protein n=1 Tax=Vibrio mediterranei TaxID=689 RepID=UPI0038CE0F6B